MNESVLFKRMDLYVLLKRMNLLYVFKAILRMIWCAFVYKSALKILLFFKWINYIGWFPPFLLYDNFIFRYSSLRTERVEKVNYKVFLRLKSRWSKWMNLQDMGDPILFVFISFVFSPPFYFLTIHLTL